MPQDAKPAASDDGGNRKIIISDWKPHSKNTLRGFFTATLPSGLVFHDLMLHEREGARWIAFPAREWTDQLGAKQYTRFIEFRDPGCRNRFRDEMLAALDAHLAAAVQ